VGTTRGRRHRSLAGQLFVLQLVVLTVVVLAGAGLALLGARRDGQDAARREVLGVAESVAQVGSTRQALATGDPAATLQPLAESVRRNTGVDFVVVMAPDRTRYSHPNPALIGKPFVGTIAPALAGQAFTEVHGGSLGPSIRAVVPVQDPQGTVVGLVAVGITQAAVGRQLGAQLPLLLGVAALGLLLAAAGSLLLSRRIRRQTLGMGPDELRSMYEHQDAVLHAIREGLVVVGPNREVQLVNDETRRLLELGPGFVRTADLPSSIQELVRSAAPVTDEIYLTGQRTLLVSQVPAVWENRSLGSVLTLRDHTELQGALGELDSVRSFAESLRSQAHESANRLHTIITMVELGRPEDAVAFATAELALSQNLIDRLLAAVEEPALAALLLGKVSESAERGVQLTVSEDTALTTDTGLTSRELVTIVGNLLDNAVDAAAAGSGTESTSSPWVEISVRTNHDTLVVAVADSGPGMATAELKGALRRGHSTKNGHHGLGLALVAQVAARHGGRVHTDHGEVSALTVVLPLRVRA
jgi:two-component system CitB family sensor kinase